jgi:hypothetical protein
MRVCAPHPLPQTYIHDTEEEHCCEPRLDGPCERLDDFARAPAALLGHGPDGLLRIVLQREKGVRRRGSEDGAKTRDCAIQTAVRDARAASKALAVVCLPSLPSALTSSRMKRGHTRAAFGTLLACSLAHVWRVRWE